MRSVSFHAWLILKSTVLAGYIVLTHTAAWHVKISVDGNYHR